MKDVGQVLHRSPLPRGTHTSSFVDAASDCRAEFQPRSVFVGTVCAWRHTQHKVKRFVSHVTALDFSSSRMQDADVRQRVAAFARVLDTQLLPQLSALQATRDALSTACESYASLPDDLAQTAAQQPWRRDVALGQGVTCTAVVEDTTAVFLDIGCAVLLNSPRGTRDCTAYAHVENTDTEARASTAPVWASGQN